MTLQVCGWRVENYVRVGRDELPLDQLPEQDRRRLAQRIYMAFARALAPQQIEIRDVRLVPSGRRRKFRAVDGSGEPCTLTPVGSD